MYLACEFDFISFEKFLVNILLLLWSINATQLFVQLFEQLSLQETLGGGEPRADHDDGAAEPKPSEDVGSKRDKGVVSVKTRDSAAHQKKKYGKVHTRHINQLFIRGENVILVNPQPLWFLFDFRDLTWSENSCEYWVVPSTCDVAGHCNRIQTNRAQAVISCWYDEPEKWPFYWGIKSFWILAEVFCVWSVLWSLPSRWQHKHTRAVGEAIVIW